MLQELSENLQKLSALEEKLPEKQKTLAK